MRQSSVALDNQSPEGEVNNLNSELWHACAGPLISLPAVGSHVVYFPQGHSEQVAVSTNKEVDGQIPNYPSLPPQLICQLHNLTMHADIETDEVHAQMTLQPLNAQEQKEMSFLPADLGGQCKQPTNYFCKTLTASDTSTHGGFSVPRRAAEKVFPPLDFSMQPPCQELIARDLHNNEWKFRHIFRGQPKRHLLTTGWSVFVSAKRLVAGDSVLFIWNDQNQLFLGIRRATRPQTVMPSSVLSSDSMHLGLLAAAAHAAATNSRFTIFFNPRASPSEFVIPLAKYVKAVYHTRVSVGMRFRMLFETEESSVRRYMGTITGISDLDPAKWQNSHWRSVKVGWDESTAGRRQPRVSLWEIEPLTTFPMYPSPFALRLKRPWPPGLPSFTGMPSDDMGFNPSFAWPRGDLLDRGMQTLNFQGMGMTPNWMQSSVLGMQQNEIYQAMAAHAALQDMRVLDPSKQILPSIMQFPQSQILQQAQSLPSPQSYANFLQQQLHQQNVQQSQHVYDAQQAQSHFSSNSQANSQTNSFSNVQLQQKHVQQSTSPQHIYDAQRPVSQLSPHSQANSHTISSFNNVQLQQQHVQQQSAALQHARNVFDAQQTPSQISSNSQANSQTTKSFNNVQHQPTTMQQVSQAYDTHHVQSQLSSNTQANSQAMQMHQSFQESNIKPVRENMSSPLNSLFGSVTQDEMSRSNGWPSKRVALDPIFSNGISCGISNHLVPTNTNGAQLPVSLPPFPGVDHDGSNDAQNHFLFGVNIDSSSLLMPNGMSNLKAISSERDNTPVSFASPSYMSGSGTDYIQNPTVISSSYPSDELGLLHSENLANTNPPDRNFVKVYKSGSFGRSLDISMFSNYHELRGELARMFGLEGQLEDPLRSGWQLVFVDRENDVLLLGDDPWQEFVNNVWCIKILSPKEVQDMGKRGLELLSSIPIQKLPSNVGCDGFVTRQEVRNMNHVVPPVGTLDF